MIHLDFQRTVCQKTGNNPNGFTEKNIETFTKQLKELVLIMTGARL